jgi:hypothetical protein
MFETRCHDSLYSQDDESTTAIGPGEQVLFDLTHHAVDRVLRTVAVRVVAGPDAGRVHRLELAGGPAARPLRGGRSDLCDLVLADPRVSDVHFELVPLRGQLVLRDLDSAGGVFVGQARVREAWLAPGSSFTVGGTTLELVVAEAEARPLAPFCHFGDLDGESPAMRLLFQHLTELAFRGDRRHGVFSGEPGTGKAVAAESLHLLSPERGAAFITCDLGKLAHERVDNELFGTPERRGALALARHGTLLVRAIDELSLASQAALARALPRAQLRLFVTTRRDLQSLTAAGLFDRGLYAALSGFHVVMPPLRERGRDVVFLADRIVARLDAADGLRKKLSADALAALREHAWPGNVRELRFVLERAHFSTSRGPISRADLGLGRGLEPSLARVESLLRGTHDEAVLGFETLYFRHQIDRHKTKISAARAAGMTGEGFRLACRRVRVY